MAVKRGWVYYADLGILRRNHVQAGKRPVVIIQNDIGNIHSPTTIVVPLTTAKKKPLPTHVAIDFNNVTCIALCEQVQTIGQKAIQSNPVAELQSTDMVALEHALRISLGIK